MTKVKKTVKISDTTDVKLRSVSEQMHVTQGSVIEKAIAAYKPGAGSSSSQDLLVWSELQRLDHDLQNVLNLLNSLVHNLNFESYHSAANDPHKWLAKSNSEYKDRIIKSKTAALMENKKSET